MGGGGGDGAHERRSAHCGNTGIDIGFDDGAIQPRSPSSLRANPLHNTRLRRMRRRLRALFVVLIVGAGLVTLSQVMFPARSCADGGAGCGRRLRGGITDDAMRVARDSWELERAPRNARVEKVTLPVTNVWRGEAPSWAPEEELKTAAATVAVSTVPSRHGEDEGREEDGDRRHSRQQSVNSYRGNPRQNSSVSSVSRMGHEYVIPAPGHRPDGEANLIVIITPTYERPTSKAPPQPNMLLAMRNMLCSSHGHQFLWVLVMGREDHDHVNPAHRIPKCGRHHTSIVHNVTIVSEAAGIRSRSRHRGVDQRNAGIAFLHDEARFNAALRASRFVNVNPHTVDPVVYFGDDDNEYDPLLWDEMVKVKRLGVWPVGFPFAMAPYYVETVSVGETGKVIGYNSMFCDRRLYNMDMAAFGVRRSYMKNAHFKQTSRPGHIEDDFLQMVMGQDGANTMEVLADGATQIYVWHLGWHFDKAKGAYRLKTEVKQPAPITCKPLNEQMARGRMHLMDRARSTMSHLGYHGSDLGKRLPTTLTQETAPAEAEAAGCRCQPDPVHAVTENELADLLKITDNFKGMRTYVEFGSSSELGAQLWSTLHSKSHHSSRGIGSTNEPSFYTFETVRRYCKRLECWEQCARSARSSFHVACASDSSTTMLLDIWGNLRDQHKRSTFSKLYNEAYVGALQRLLAGTGASGLDFVALDGRFRVAMALKVYAELSPQGLVLLGNCGRVAYREIFNFYDKVHVLGESKDASYEGEESEIRCLLRRKTGVGAPTTSEADSKFHEYMTSDGGEHPMGS